MKGATSMQTTLARALVVTAALLAVLPAAAVTPSADLLKCQKTIHSKIRSFVNVTQTALLGCAQKVEDCKLAQEIDGVPPSTCLSAASTACGASSGKIAVLQSVAVGKANLA